MNPGPGAAARGRLVHVPGGTETRAKREEDAERVVWRAHAPAAPIYAPVTEPSGAIKLAL